MSKPNPQNNSIIQALIDLKNTGHGKQTVDNLIELLNSDKKQADELQNRWNGHLYPTKKMTFTQVTISDDYFHLPDTALRILLILGMYSGKTGLIQVSKSDIMALTGLKQTSIKTGLKILTDHGFIRVAQPSARHAAPVYEINRKYFAQGDRPRHDDFDYSDADNSKSPSNIEREYIPVIDIIRTSQDDQTTAYNRLTAQKKEPTSSPQPDDSHESTTDKIISSKLKPVKVSHKTDMSHKMDWSKYPDDLDGQMNISDYIDVPDVPDDPDDPRLPFNM